MYIADVVVIRIFPFAFIVLFLALADSYSQCPSITVIGPAGVTGLGDKMTFRADVGIMMEPKIEYRWSVSAGTITDGQGTSVISVLTDRAMAGGNVTATVEIGGLLEGCAKAASETAPVETVMGCGLPSDEWGSIKQNDQRGRLDVAFAELLNNPTYLGFFLMEITHDERLDSGNKRIQFILRHAKFRGFDAGRIWFGLELGEEKRTKFYLSPPGAEKYLPCTECLIIKGGDIK